MNYFKPKTNNIISISSTKKSAIFLFIAVTVILFAIFIPFYINGYAFNIGQDFRDQFELFYYDYVQTITNSIKTHTLPFYSFDIFLGNSYWSSRLFYYNNIYDFITYPISMLFRNIRYEEISIIQLSLKAYVSAFTMFTYIKYRRFNNETAILSSLAFTFSSFYFGFISFHFFLSFYSFVPLYFFFIEAYLNSSKFKTFYIFIVTFLIITNYYQFYTLSILTIIYYLYRYHEIHQTFKYLIKNTYLIIIYYLIGILISAPITVPNFIQLLGNNRLNDASTMIFFSDIKTYIQIFFGYFIPSSVLNGSLNTIFTSEWTYRFSFAWGGSIVALLLPQILFSKNKDKKLLLIILILIMFFPLGSSMMHAFTDASFRWTQFIPFFTIILTLNFLESPSLINNKILTISGILYIFILLILPISILVIQGLDSSINFQQMLVLAIYAILIALSLLIFNKKHIPILKYLFVIELIFVGNFSLFYNQTHKILDSKTIDGAINTLGNSNELNTFLNKDSENEFYRVYVDYNSIYWGYSYNMNLKYNFKPLMSYDSLMTTASHDIDKIANQNLFVNWAKSITNPELVNFFNTKYAIVTDTNQLPHQDFTYYGDYNYGLQVYENNKYYNLIRTYSKIETYDEYSKNNNPSDINTYIISNADDYEKIKKLIGSEVKLGADIVGTKENYLYSEFTSFDAGFATIAIPYDKGWNIYINGEKVEYYKVNAGVIGISIFKGTNIIEMSYHPVYFSLSLKIALIGVLTSFVLLILDLKRLTNN